MQHVGVISTTEIPNLSERLIEFARNFPLAMVLDSNSSAFPSFGKEYKKYNLVAGFAEFPLSGQTITGYEGLATITERNSNWYLGYLTYDIKNSIENLCSSNRDELGWPSMLLFVPDVLILQENDSVTIFSDHSQWNKQKIISGLLACNLKKNDLSDLVLHPRMTKNVYLEQICKIKEQIALGNIYEINFCQEFSDNSEIDPYQRFRFMNAHSPAPFSAFLKYEYRYLLSASPERFLMKENSKIISQPIKGTASRGITNDEDSCFKTQLEQSLKERTENIMIVDLVRNDLSRIANKDTVRVEDLCGIYTYPHVHQMISTIAASLPSLSFQEIIRATFPMGSMTGAPKINAMKMIEEYENVKRGLYSGTVGYIAPGMDFDFNVVIRSLQYNAANHYLSYMTGSAITALSDPEKEYEECLLKAYAINSTAKQPVYAQ
jgi:para-aminobenzoate synthetase component 1